MKPGSHSYHPCQGLGLVSFGFDSHWIRRSKNKKNFHNHILLSMMGPVYVKLVDVTGESGAGENIAAEVLKVQKGNSKRIVKMPLTFSRT